MILVVFLHTFGVFLYFFNIFHNEHIYSFLNLKKLKLSFFGLFYFAF